MSDALQTIVDAVRSSLTQSHEDFVRGVEAAGVSFQRQLNVAGYVSMLREAVESGNVRVETIDFAAPGPHTLKCEDGVVREVRLDRRRGMVFIDDFGATGPHTVTGDDGRTWTFKYQLRFGPLLLRKDGEISKRQPQGEGHPFWDAFEKWEREHA